MGDRIAVKEDVMFTDKRVFRFFDEQKGAFQISAFPETPPSGEADLDIRIKHFTEIENFGFLAYVLAHELGGGKQRIHTLNTLVVPDAEVQALVLRLRNERLTDESLGDELLDVTINWEHFVASTNNLLIPGDPLKITDARLQGKIDSLDNLSEALVAEVNRRSAQESQDDDDQGRRDRRAGN
jgi:hypothetical protein